MNNITKNRLRRGFTLAEVLITLLIIGVVASIVIPGLISNTSDAEYAVALKKAYANLSQVTRSIITENSGIAGTYTNDATLMSLYTPYLNVARTCAVGTGDGVCWPAGNLSYLSGGSYADINGMFPTALLADGTTIAFRNMAADCSFTMGDQIQVVCASLYVDVNGLKGPNRLGKDTFWFRVTKQGIYPWGTYNDGYSDCSKSTNGFGCAGKVIKEGAINY